MKHKNLYDALLESEELFKMYKNLTGDWEKDKNKFIKEQQKLEELLNG